MPALYCGINGVPHHMLSSVFSSDNQVLASYCSFQDFEKGGLKTIGAKDQAAREKVRDDSITTVRHNVAFSKSLICRGVEFVEIGAQL